MFNDLICNDSLTQAPSVRKVLVVDFDIHHGNGTQERFYQDDKVLFFSVHRYQKSSFLPYGYMLKDTFVYSVLLIICTFF